MWENFRKTLKLNAVYYENTPTVATRETKGTMKNSKLSIFFSFQNLFNY